MRDKITSLELAVHSGNEEKLQYEVSERNVFCQTDLTRHYILNRIKWKN